jgi:hypothetical protein
MFIWEITAPGELTVHDHRGSNSGWAIELVVGEILAVVPEHGACAPGLNIAASRRRVEKTEEKGPLGTTEGDWKIYYSLPTPIGGMPILHINGRTFMNSGGRQVEIPDV